MDVKKVSFYELQNMHAKELKEKYKITDRQLEQSVRKHLDGATSQDMQNIYKDVWYRKK